MGRFLPPAGVWMLIMVAAGATFMGLTSPALGEVHNQWISFKPGRSAVVARHGAVSTSHPLASQVGLEILKKGGNAADAAVAANAMLGLIEPMSCGIGGDLFVLYWDAQTQKLYGLNASGRSPYALSREVFKEKGMSEIPIEGPLAWSVPGAVRGWEDLLDRFGTMGFDEVLAPAIEHAENGFPVSPRIGASWRGAAEGLRLWNDSAATYLFDGRGPATGEIFRNPNLARSYRAIAQGGADAFYKGSIAQTIVAFSQANGGYFSLRDFADHESTWVEPVSTNYRGYELWEIPPNGQGISALQILNILEGYDIASLGPGHPDYIHLYTEAKKLAYADRAKFYADPAFNKLPIAELISKEYAAKRRALIDMSKALVGVPAGDPKLAHGDTIYLSVVDKDRNACSLIQSNYYGFGSKVVPGDVGFVIQNRGSQFALDPDHFNTLEPHKRPFHTIIPAMVTKDGKPWLCYGVMGGDMQPQGHVQVLINLVDFGMDVQAAGDAPRVRHDGSATPTGQSETPHGGTLLMEWNFSDAALEALRAKGHRVQGGGFGLGFGGYQGILIDWKLGTLQAGSELRNDGMAVGY